MYAYRKILRTLPDRIRHSRAGRFSGLHCRVDVAEGQADVIDEGAGARLIRASLCNRDHGNAKGHLRGARRRRRRQSRPERADVPICGPIGIQHSNVYVVVIDGVCDRLRRTARRRESDECQCNAHTDSSEHDHLPVSQPM